MPENWVLQNLEQVKSARMQDIHGIGEGGGGGGRFIGGGDRRLRPLIHQAVKCPRCDSLNTKFCYYNNYNLSQPRHFCKSCRRYWTKGGVLRNVPVGGGCRKTKRSKPKTNASSSADDAAEDNKSTTQSPSSESSSLTTTTAAATAAAAPPSSAGEVPAPYSTKSDSSALLYNFADASFSNVNPQPNPNPNLQPSDNHPQPDGQIFSTEIASLISPSDGMMMGLDFHTTSYARDEQPVTEKPTAANTDELKIEDTSNDELAAALDWGSGGDGGDQALFDLTAGVDPAYWSQSDWTDNDQSLNYLP